MIVIDLRTEQEKVNRPVLGALSLPVAKPPLRPKDAAWLAERIAALPPGPIAFFCARGIRSQLAFALSQSMGREAANLGGIETIDP